MAGAFVAIVIAGDDRQWWGYAQAAAEGSLVGGLADWFAVTALFRHPLGLPIPHTAVIRERKDQFGETLGAFVQENFLAVEVVLERVRAANAPARLATWLVNPDNAAKAAANAGTLVVGLADAIRDEDVHRILEEELNRGVEGIPVAPLAARGLRMATADGRHEELFEVIVRGFDRFLQENREDLRARFSFESPWWLPDAVEDRIFDRLLGGVTTMLHGMATDPNHEMRQTFNARVEDLIVRLETDETLLARGEELKRDLLAHPELRGWSAALWRDIKASLRRQAAEPDSELSVRLATAAVVLGRRLESDPELLAKVEQMIESAVRYVIEHYKDEVAALVSSTVSRWDAEETSDKLELLLGRDLQFIRINGTVVGGLAGLAIHGGAAVLA